MVFSSENIIYPRENASAYFPLSISFTVYYPSALPQTRSVGSARRAFPSPSSLISYGGISFTWLWGFRINGTKRVAKGPRPFCESRVADGIQLPDPLIHECFNVEGAPDIVESGWLVRTLADPPFFVKNCFE